MDITPEQALEELKKRGYKVPTTAPNARFLPTSAPTADLNEPLFKPPEYTEKELIGQLGGIIPKGEIPEWEIEERFPHPEEITRQQAYNELVKRGYTPTQMETITSIEKELKPSFWESFRPKAGQTIGGIAGGAAGGAYLATMLGQIPPFTALPEELITVPLGAAIGAAVGGAAGKGAQVGIEEKRWPKPSELMLAGGEESLYELGGRYGVMGLKAVASPLVKKTIPEAAALTDDFAKVGGQFSPAQLDKRFSIRMAESYSRGGLLAPLSWKEFGEKQGVAAAAYADDIVDSIASGVARKSPSEIGQVFAEGITRPSGRIFQLLDDLVDPLYKQVDELTKGVTVSTQKLKTFAAKELATDSRLNKQYLSNIGRTKLNRIIGMDDTLSFSDMRLLRSSYLKDARKLARDVDKADALVKRLAKITNESIFDPDSAKGLTFEARNLLQNTNNLYRAAQEGLETTFSEKLLNRIIDDPGRVIKEVFPQKNPEAIKLMREALTEPIKGRPSKEGKIVWDQLRKAWLSDAVEKSITDGRIKHTTFERLIHNMGQSYDEMFTATERSRIATIGELTRRIEHKGFPGFTLFSKAAQIKAGYEMYQGIQEGDFIQVTVAGAIALGPMTYVRLATNPQGLKLLTSGIKMRPGSSEIGPLVARMIRFLRERDLAEAKSGYKAKRAEYWNKQLPFIKEPAMEELRGFGGRGF